MDIERSIPQKLGTMMYSLFEMCSVGLNGEHNRRGARIICGHCGNETETNVNTMRLSGADDGSHIERFIIKKFERLGWKVGNSPKQHRCPSCYTAIKMAAKRKQQEKIMAEKVINLQKPTTPAATPPLTTSTALQSTMKDKVSASGQQQPRAMNREEKYLIIKKLDEHYIIGKGYTNNWDDAKVAQDLGVSVVYVAEVRGDIFGPNVDEEMSAVLLEAKALSKEAEAIVQPIKIQLTELLHKMDELFTKITQLEKRK
jgi:hypothetical protein